MQYNLKSLVFVMAIAITLFFNVPTIYAQPSQSVRFYQPGYYQMRLGEVNIIALSDGTAPQDLKKLLIDTLPGELEQISEANYQQTTIECSVNAYLIKISGKLILIDAGTSSIYGAQLGHLTQSLAKAGYKPEQIDAVLLTHIHMDHIGGVVNGNTPVFPNATIYISSDEARYWLNADNKSKSSKEQEGFFEGAQLKLAPIKKLGKLKTFEFGQALFPGIIPVAGKGHTPGHTFYQVKSGDQKIVFVGDIVVSQPVQFTNPGISSIYDLDPKQGKNTRIAAFNAAADGGYWIAISHASFPGIGHIARTGAQFRWIPINYSSNGNGQ